MPKYYVDIRALSLKQREAVYKKMDGGTVFPVWLKSVEVIFLTETGHVTHGSYQYAVSRYGHSSEARIDIKETISYDVRIREAPPSLITVDGYTYALVK